MTSKTNRRDPYRNFNFRASIAAVASGIITYVAMQELQALTAALIAPPDKRPSENEKPQPSGKKKRTSPPR